mmetsp:Transcript_2291/g.3213  ORF Transcript_2291/g.3213 Transcript_2291/m.3213 type:complete len:516 (+) Transcript_2291:89-1636(+)
MQGNHDNFISPSRVVLAFDLDCFYAQVVIKNNPDLRNKPVAVRQKYITVTCNYEARKYGVTKLCSLEEAKRLCPALVIVDGSDLTPFREASEKIYNFWKSRACGCPIERKGFDECFLDITELVKVRLRGISGFPVFEGYIFGDVEKESKINNLHVQMLAVGSQIASDWRMELKSMLGYTCCGGISFGKLSAKFAVEMNKPDKQSIILPSKFHDFLSDIPCRRLQGIGRVMNQRLLEEYRKRYPNEQTKETKSITCANARQFSFSVLMNMFENNSKTATFVYNSVRGIDEEPVLASLPLAKTVSQEETSLPHPTTRETACTRLRVLCDRLIRLVLERKVKSGQIPSTLRVTIVDKLLPRKSQESVNLKKRGRNRRTESRQTKIFNADMVFKNGDSIYKSSHPLLLKLLNNLGCDGSFKLARMNLAVADFLQIKEKRPNGNRTKVVRKSETDGRDNIVQGQDYSHPRIATNKLPQVQRKNVSIVSAFKFASSSGNGKTSVNSRKKRQKTIKSFFSAG